MDVQIREATEDDAEALSRLLLEVHNLHAEALPHAFQRIEADDRTADELRCQITQEGSGLFVAERAGALVGYVSLRLFQVPPFLGLVPRRVAEIDAVVVGKAFRRRGVGEALVRRAEVWAAEQGIEHVDLTVHEFNAAAIALYEKLGYATVLRGMWRSLADCSPTAGGAAHGGDATGGPAVCRHGLTPNA